MTFEIFLRVAELKIDLIKI